MARDFPGAGTDYFQIGDVAAIDITGTLLTIAAWFEPDNVGAWNAMIAKAQSSVGSIQYNFYVSNGSKFYSQIGDSGGEDTVIGATTLTNGTRYHGVLVKNGTGVGALKNYLNGVEDGSVTSNRSIQNTTNVLRFGQTSGGVDVFNGRLAEVGIWNVALTPAEIVALAKGLTPLDVRPGSSLKGYWPLWGVAAPEPDFSGNLNNAVLNGTVPVAKHPPIGRFSVSFSGIDVWPDINTPSAASGFTDAAEVYFDLQASGTDIYSQAFVDAAEIYLDLQPSGVDVAERVDSATIYFDLQASGIELRESIDSATIYLNLQASGVDIFATPCLIIGDGEAFLRWNYSDSRLRWLASDADLRWGATLQLGTGEC